jgi:hypothetical protein
MLLSHPDNISQPVTNTEYGTPAQNTNEDHYATDSIIPGMAKCTRNHSCDYKEYTQN